MEALAAAANSLIADGMKTGGLTGFFTSFRTQVPQIYLNIDRDKAEALNVPIDSVFQTLQTYLGAYYVNDFNFLGRTYQVNLQADSAFRCGPTRSATSTRATPRAAWSRWAPCSTVQEINAPDKIMHYNIYPSADINGNTLPGVSSGEAIQKMEEAAKKLPPQFGFEWTELTLQEKLAGNTALFISRCACCSCSWPSRRSTRAGACRWSSS